jgi:hypothetical protein
MFLRDFYIQPLLVAAVAAHSLFAVPKSVSSFLYVALANSELAIIKECRIVSGTKIARVKHLALPKRTKRVR